MKYGNFVFLQGKIGDDFKYLKTEQGQDFATFTLLVETKYRGVSALTMIRIMVFDKNLVDYLRKVSAHQGQWCTIKGSLSSYRRELKGQDIVQNNVYVIDITITKTSE